MPIDIALGWLPFEREAIERSTLAEYESVRVRSPRPDDLLIDKLVASRPRDLGDAEQLLLLHGGTMDFARVRRVIRELAGALEDPDRPAALEHLIQKAGLV